MSIKKRSLLAAMVFVASANGSAADNTEPAVLPKPSMVIAVKTQLNFTNATDELYFPSSYGNSNRIAQGTPKNVLASINVNF